MQNIVSNFLVAVPHMGDGFYDESVVFVYKQTSSYVAGLVLNKRSMTSLGTVYEKIMGSPFPFGKSAYPVYLGARPDEEDQNELARAPTFLLHSPDYRTKESEVVAPDVLFTRVSGEVLKDLSDGRIPHHMGVYCGGAVWELPGIQAELAMNGWGLLPFSHHRLFVEDRKTLWQTACRDVQKAWGPDRPFVLNEGMETRRPPGSRLN